MKPEAIPETVSTIAQLGPWGLVVLVVVCVLIAVGALVFVFWKVASAATGKLIEVLDKHAKALDGLNLQFAEHKLFDERLHAATREEVRDEVAKVKSDVAGLIVGVSQDLERAEHDIKAHVVSEIKLARAGVSSPFMSAVRPARGSRPGG